MVRWTLNLPEAMMRGVRWMLAVGLVAVVVPMRAQQGGEAEVKALITKYLAAEQAFDSAALAKLVTPGYFEISPVGEYDDHDRFLGFYTADKRVEYPPSTISEEHVEMFGGGSGAVYSFKIAYAMKNPDGSPRSMEIRCTYVVHREGDGVWKVVSAVSTPVRSKPKA
jgi:ketosteroid isomerase-like protein